MPDTSLLIILEDLALIVFDLLLFTRLFQLRKNDRRHRMIMGLGCVCIVAFYFVAVYVWGQAPSVAAALYMSIPSFVLFFCLARYRDARFVLTFCFADTVTLAAGVVTRWIALSLPYGRWVSLSLALLLLGGLSSRSGWQVFGRYRELQDVEKAGWGAMAVAGIIIYAAFVFILCYPQPLLLRPEYIPVTLVFCSVVVACYVVLILSVIKTRQIHQQNQQLQEEKRYYHMAFTDALTGLGNRAAYLEQLNDCERAQPAVHYCCVMLDANKFKHINDAYGHAMGDKALQALAEGLLEAFGTGNVFRVGGDEFAVLLAGETEDGIAGRLTALEGLIAAKGAALGIPLSAAAGWAFANSGEGRMEHAFHEADRRMYEQKLKK